MNRAEFMRRLTELLGDVSPMERDEAIQYYNDYFDDAGVENESGVIASLGTPEELARTIKAGLSDGGGGGEFTEAGFHGYAQAHRDEIVRAGETDHAANMGGAQDAGTGGNAYYQGGYYQRTGGDGIYGGREDTRRHDNPYERTGTYHTYGNAAGNGTPPKKGMSGGTIVVIAILAVLTSPIWLGLVGTLFGVAVALLVVLLAVFIAFLAVGFALVVASVALLVTGFTLLFSLPLGGVCLIGTALIAFALGLVFVWLMVLIAGAIPAFVRSVAALCQRLFHRGGARA